MNKYNNSTNPLPDEFRAVGSPFMVNVLLEIGYSPEDTLTLLRYAHENNDHPDWSEDTMAQIEYHFSVLKQMIEMETA